MLLKDKVALVTGGAAGIGAAIATLFREEGAQVLVLDKQPAGPDSVQVDVRSPSQIKGAVDQALSRFGHIDILINNAGIYPRQPFLSMTEQEWDEMLDINLKGLFHCGQAVVPHLIAQRSGKIVNISSVTFLRGVKNLVHYVSAKGGVIGFTRSLARELGEHNIHVNCITPGAIETESEAQFVTPEGVAAMVAQQCLARRILPIDIARACVFLSSAMADGMTGQTLNVDGGWLMH